MGTEFQRLTAPHDWSPEGVQTDSAWNLEAHHVVSQARLQLPRGFRRPPTRGGSKCVAMGANTDPDRHRPLCPQLSPSRRPLPCCGFDAWRLLGPNPNPSPTPNQDPPPKPKPASIPNAAIEPPSGMGPHFSPQGRSRHQTGFSPGDILGSNHNPS